jgi:hypothetical protein
MNVSDQRLLKQWEFIRLQVATDQRLPKYLEYVKRRKHIYIQNTGRLVHIQLN